MSLKSFRASFFRNSGFISHRKTIFSNLSKLGDAPKINLGTILESNYNITPFSDETWHYLNVLDHLIREIASFLTRQSRNHCHPQVGEPVSEVKSPRNRGQSQGQPKQSKTKKKISQQVAVVGAAVEEHDFFGGVSRSGGGGPRSVGGGRDEDAGGGSVELWSDF